MYKILVPVDGSDHSLKALHIACDLADKYKARIILLYVLDPYKAAGELLELPIARRFSPELLAILQKSIDEELGSLSTHNLETIGQKILEIAANRVERLGIEAHVMAIAAGDPAENILSAYKLVSASTIVMGSRGGKWSSLSSFGSVSNKVFARADCTCISVK